MILATFEQKRAGSLEFQAPATRDAQRLLAIYPRHACSSARLEGERPVPQWSNQATASMRRSSLARPALARPWPGPGLALALALARPALARLAPFRANWPGPVWAWAHLVLSGQFIRFFSRWDPLFLGPGPSLFRGPIFENVFFIVKNFSIFWFY